MWHSSSQPLLLFPKLQDLKHHTTIQGQEHRHHSALSAWPLVYQGPWNELFSSPCTKIQASSQIELPLWRPQLSFSMDISRHFSSQPSTLGTHPFPRPWGAPEGSLPPYQEAQTHLFSPLPQWKLITCAANQTPLSSLLLNSTMGPTV